MNVRAEMRDVLGRYGLALLLAGVALALRQVTPHEEGTSTYQLSVAAVILSAWYGGRGPGLLASLVSTLGISYLFLPPIYSAEVSPDYVSGLLMFVALALLLVEFGARRRRTEHALQASEGRFKQVNAALQVEVAKNELQVRESKERLSALAGSTDEVVFEFDGTGKYLNVWTSNEALLVRPRHELIGRTLADAFDEGWARHHLERVGRVLETGTPEIYEWRIDLPSGRSWFLGRMNPMPSLQGARRTVCCLVRDITQQKRDEGGRRAQLGVAEALADSDSIAAAAPDLLEAVGESLEWDWGALWIVDRERGRLRCEALWHSAARVAGELDELSVEIALQSRERGPVRVCETGQPDWQETVAEHCGSRRSEIATHAGFKSGVVFPILDLHAPKESQGDGVSVVAAAFAPASGTAEVTRQAIWQPIGGEVLGAIELFSRYPRERDERHLAIFNVIGAQIGQFLKRKRAEAELRERQQMLELAQSAARAVAFDWRIGARENENRWSPPLEAMHGLEPGTFDGTFESWKKLVHPGDWPTVKLALERASESGDVDAEYRVVHKGGAVQWLHAQGRMFFEAEGRPERVLGFMIDVTDRRHAEEALRSAETRFRTFVDHAADAFFLHDEQLRVVDVNRQACESMRRTREELIGMHPGDFAVGMDERVISRLAQRSATGEAVNFESRHRRKDGTSFPVEVRAGTFMQSGKRFYLALARDITERQQAEERRAKLAAIVESSDDAIISKDLNGVITTWNPGAERIFGYAAPEVIGQSITMLMPPDRIDEARSILERIRSGERVDHYETVRRRKDGTRVDLSLSVSPIVDASGNTVGASKVARDISERKRAERSLREKDHALETTRTELAHVSRLTTLGELTTSIAHEVSQPLSAMLTSAGACARWLAADPPAMAEARAALDNIVADGKRGREVMARIRALTKRQALRKESLDINLKIAEVLVITQHELRSHDIVLRTELGETLPRPTGDRVQLQQVLLNLIMNAIEAMSGVHDRPRELTIVSRKDGAAAVLIEVRDSGHGFHAQHAEQVFEPFFTTKAEGIGIGLSISRSIIEAHGGRLWAGPNEPHGAVFRFSLPAAEGGVS